MSSPISSRVTPLASARSGCPASWSLRDIAVSAATVTRLRSRFERPGRSQTSPYRTVSLSSMSFGATCRTSLRAADADGGVLNGGSFPFGSWVSLRRQAERTLTGRQCEPGVDDERLARDPARLVAREIDRAPADVPAGALGTQRTRAPPALAGVGAEVLDHRRPHGTRRDGVDANALGAELDRDGADEPDDAGLRRGVRRAPVAPWRGDRGDADDRAAAAAHHRGDGRPRGEEHGLEVDGDHPVPLVLRRLEEILARLDADVVVEDVEAAPALDRAPDHRLALGGVRHVGDECRRLAAFAPDHP